MWHIHPDLSWQSQDRAPPAHRPPKKVLGAELSTDPPATPQGPVMKLEEVAKCGKLWPNDQSTDSFHSGISFQCFKLGSPQAILGRTHGRHHRPQGCSRELWMQKLQRLSNILEELRVIRSRHPEPSARLGVVVPQATLIWKRGSTCNWMSDWKIPFVRPDQILCHLCLKIRVVGKLLKKLSSAPLTQRKNTSTINTSLGISLHRNRERLVGNAHHKPNSCDSAIICGNSWSHLQHGFRILHNINIASTWHNMTLVLSQAEFKSTAAPLPSLPGLPVLQQPTHGSARRRVDSACSARIIGSDATVAWEWGICTPGQEHLLKTSQPLVSKCFNHENWLYKLYSCHWRGSSHPKEIWVKTWKITRGPSNLFNPWRTHPTYSDSISRPSKTDLDGFQMTFHRSQEKRTLAIFLNFHKHFLFQKHGSSCNILQCLDTYDILWHFQKSSKVREKQRRSQGSLTASTSAPASSSAAKRLASPTSAATRKRSKRVARLKPSFSQATWLGKW